jgi:hypothetical protein
MDPNPTFYLDADPVPEPDLAPSFIHWKIGKILLLLFKAVPVHIVTFLVSSTIGVIHNFQHFRQ